VTPATVVQGLTQQFTATGTFSDGSSQDLTDQVIWSSADPSTATVSNAASSQGLATGVASGETAISATSGSITGSALLNVQPVALLSISISPSNPTINTDASIQLTATGHYSDGSSGPIGFSLIWTSLDPGVATVSPQIDEATVLHGTVGAGGTTTVTAQIGPVTGSTTVTVNPV
jgi:hypothetical protein